MRIMGLDIGTKRIGVALSDELFITAQGSDTIYRTVLAEDLEKIKRTALANMVNEVIVGLPMNMDGTYGPKVKEVIEFIEALSKVMDVPINTWDERLTTLQAERLLIEADTSRAKRKGVIDKMAAQIILQSYLDNRAKKGQANA